VKDVPFAKYKPEAEFVSDPDTVITALFVATTSFVTLVFAVVPATVTTEGIAPYLSVCPTVTAVLPFRLLYVPTGFGDTDGRIDTVFVGKTVSNAKATYPKSSVESMVASVFISCKILKN